MDQGLSRATNAPTAKGDRLARKWRVAIPAARGSTTYNTVDRTSVSQGTVTLVTPSKNAAMGAPDGQVKFPHLWPPQIPPGRTTRL